MQPFTDIRFSSVLAATGIAGQTELLTAAAALFFPAVCAVAVFLCLRHAGGQRKFLTYLLGLPLFVIPVVFLFTDPEAVLGPLFPAAAGALPLSLGCTLCVAYGIAYLGLSALICSGRLLRLWGVFTLMLSTLFCFLAESAVAFLLLTRVAGTNLPETVSGVFFGLGSGSPFGDAAILWPVLCILALYIVLFFVSFFSARPQSELKAEDIARLHVLEERARIIEKEGVCAVCRYATPIEGDEYRVMCDYKKEVEGDGHCHRFEYDPLKRKPAPDAGKTVADKK